MQGMRISDDAPGVEDRLSEAEPHALARVLNRAPSADRTRAMRALPNDKAVWVFGLLEPTNQLDVLQSADENERRRLLHEMEPDDRARMLSFLSDDDAEALLQQLTPDERATTRTVLGYPRHSAGRIMSPEFMRLTPEMSVSDALVAIRAGQKRAETVFVMPVANDDMRLLGTVDLAQIVLASPDMRIADLAERNVPAVSVMDDQEEVARLMKSADLMIVPVVETQDRLVGIITFDDAMEVLEFEEGEDFARSGAAEPVGRPYLSVPVLRLVQSRIVWLSVLAVAASLTVNVLNAFEATLESVVTLALFIPLLIGIGGNAGAQSATTIVRALAIGDVAPRDALRIAWRETRTGFVMGLVISVFAFVLLSFLFDLSIALVVALTLIFICTLAALVGSLMPVIARVLSIDPAVFSAPFVTTVVDASGLLIYFLVARAVLGV
ncbi:magnesium transporter [Palleronia sp. LCG004]|uniref:magnesium transporter n=1 Tax=Palleronia sp. LCG004 TaxID=3079304 RepID=UPI002943610B|nr:magnesium transporter [Palleronia sp. LCG004]WOI58041.1 magnesium transporter [Palleronia sp. LCG004]